MLGNVLCSHQRRRRRLLMVFSTLEFEVKNQRHLQEVPVCNPPHGLVVSSTLRADIQTVAMLHKHIDAELAKRFNRREQSRDK